MSDDRFGLDRQQRILSSGIRQVFTPFKPVDDVDLLFGRSDEVKRLVESFTTPGLHALVFGERGVGKSSLANVATSMLVGAMFGDRCHTVSCTSSTTFEDLVRAPLRDVGIDISIETEEISGSSTVKGGVQAPVLNFGAENTTGNRATYRRLRPVSPEEAAGAVASSRSLLIIDEADALRSTEDKVRVAEFVKLLSDRDSRFRVLIVGIAETAAELTGAHPSVQRCIREIKLNRIPDPGLRDIIHAGAAKTDLEFDSGVIEEIVYCSDGYPFFTHLLALKSGEETIADKRAEVTPDDLARSMSLAAEDSEGSLRLQYDTAVRSPSDMFRIVVQAASLLPGPEFTSEQLRIGIENLTGSTITQQSLNNYFQRLVGEDTARVLQRLRKGMYRFSDPRMAAHVRMVNGGR